MKKLIICEKPSLARNVANALGVNNRQDGYLENDKYLVSWAFGHLLDSYSVSDYLERKVKWKDITFPFIPKEFLNKLKNDEGVKKQFNILKELINRDDVVEIVHCGDADREGQIIIDNIIKEIGTSKSVKRLWLPEQTEETIRKEIHYLKNNEDYKNLHNEGIARRNLDWLFGINLTVYLTVKSGQYLKAGRVLIPVVKYIYDRDMEIKNFISKKYYQVEGILERDNIKVTLTDERKEDTKDKADEIAKILIGKVRVVEIEKKEITKQPSKLFSLSSLQSLLSKNHKIDFASSLKTIQKLYESGYITYPRTNTEYLAENEKDKVKKIIETLKDYPLEFKDTKKIFDDSKIESHSAITITTKIPQELTGNEKIIYEVVKNRLISNFLSEKTITEKTTVKIQSLKDENVTFKLTGETVIQEGFYRYEAKDFKNELPQFTENEEFEVTFETKEKKTSPPKKVTEEELSNYLKNPFKKELKDSDDEEYKSILEGVEIGTEATRTGIIENAKEYGYISQNKSNYSIETLGKKFIELLDKLKINLYAERNVEFSKLLKQVYRNQKVIKDIVDLATTELTVIANQNIEIEKFKEEDTLENLGICPICDKGHIHQKKSKENKTFYACSEKECKFFLWENSKFGENSIKITKSVVKKFLKGGQEPFKLKNKAGKEYEAYLTIKNNNGYVKFEIAGFVNK